MAQQTSLFEFMYPQFRLTKPIRMIELFAGYGAQMLAMEYLRAKAESWRICEWAVPSFEAYRYIHYPEEKGGQSEEFDRKTLVRFLFAKGVSSDWNKPMTLSQIEQKPDSWLREAYDSIIIDRNTVNIQTTTGEDLAMGKAEREKFNVILCYSFPCQDLSLAGKGAGFSEGSGSRSSLLWEVGRLLRELKALGELPDCLVMENVIQVHASKNSALFGKWQYELSQLGYKNYVEDLKATDFGIPQTRIRCFMVSILGDYAFTFPQATPLTVRFKDLLERHVDEKYYLSQATIDHIKRWNSQVNPLKEARKRDDAKVQTITAKSNTSTNASMILLQDDDEGGEDGIRFPNANAQGYEIAHEGDGVYTNNFKNKRGVVQHGLVQTIKAGIDVGVVVADDKKGDGNG